jgi:hypothetical protein
MTTTASPTQPNAAQMIHADTQALRQDTAIILELVRSTALPMEGEEVSVLDAMIGLLRMIVDGVEQNRKSIEALHQRLEEPGIANVLRRMTDAD